jgi:hypothetical protein
MHGSAGRRSSFRWPIGAQGVKHISVQPSVSLQHLPFDAAVEASIDAGIASRLAFAVQKLDEVAATAAAATDYKGQVGGAAPGAPVCLSIMCLGTSPPLRGHAGSIAEVNRIRLFLFCVQNRTFGPYLAANNRIPISLMQSGGSGGLQAPSH